MLLFKNKKCSYMNILGDKIKQLLRGKMAVK
jgi:hypothetical protein